MHAIIMATIQLFQSVTLACLTFLSVFLAKLIDVLKRRILSLKTNLNLCIVSKTVIESIVNLQFEFSVV